MARLIQGERDLPEGEQVDGTLMEPSGKNSSDKGVFDGPLGPEFEGLDHILVGPVINAGIPTAFRYKA